MHHSINLFGNVNEKWLKKIVNISINDNDLIQLNICSEGGDSDIALAIVDLMNSLKSRATFYTFGIGRVHSAAADILAFGSHGYRGVTCNTSIMFHEQLTTLQERETTKHIAFLNFESKRQEQFNRQLAQYIGQDYHTFENDLKNELWLMPEDALKYGVIDKIL